MRKPLNLTIEYVKPKQSTSRRPYDQQAFISSLAGCVVPQIGTLIDALNEIPSALAQARKVLEAADPVEAAKARRIEELRRELATLEGDAEPRQQQKSGGVNCGNG